MQLGEGERRLDALRHGQHAVRADLAQPHGPAAHGSEHAPLTPLGSGGERGQMQADQFAPGVLYRGQQDGQAHAAAIGQRRARMEGQGGGEGTGQPPADQIGLGRRIRQRQPPAPHV